MLDSKYYSLSNSELIIKAEKSESLIDTIYFNNLLDLRLIKLILFRSPSLKRRVAFIY